MRFFLTILILFFATQPSLAAELPPHKEQPNLTILADEGLLLPLAQLARHYATATHTPLTIVLKNTDDAERQIEQGLEAHVVLSANTPLIDRLAAQGLTDVSSRRAVARTSLALVATRELSKRIQFSKRISFAAMLYATPNLPVYANQPPSFEGERVQRLLSGYEFSESLAKRLGAQPRHDEVIAMIRDGEGLGLILAADAVAERDLVVLSLLPDTVSPPVTYETVVLGSESMAEAKAFTTYLSSREAEAIFAHYGFQPPAN